jgi:hypothetical protein
VTTTQRRNRLASPKQQAVLGVLHALAGGPANLVASAAWKQALRERGVLNRSNEHTDFSRQMEALKARGAIAVEGDQVRPT